MGKYITEAKRRLSAKETKKKVTEANLRRSNLPYKVIFAQTAADLADEVCDALQNGWALVGGVSYKNAGDNSGYLQAVRKED